MISTKKIPVLFTRLLLLVVYAVFFTVQLTAYFDHTTGHTYRLSDEVFHASKIAKEVPDGFSNSNSAAKKLSIRLNKKFHGQSALLYAMFTSKELATDFIKQSTPVYFDPFNAAAFLLEHPFRGPPVIT